MENDVLLIINPRSGKSKRKEIFSEVESIISAENHTVTTVFTDSRGHATEIARSGKDYNRIICMGGDGTLSEVCNGILALPENERPKLGYIPAGSTNDFAKGIGLPTNFKKSARLASSDKCSPIDIGSFKADGQDERFFTYVASFGAFTKISYSTDQNIKNKLGHFAYIFEGIKSIADLQSFKPFRLRIEADGTVLEQEYIFGAITNSTSLGGLVKLDKKNVHVNDGMFELLLIRKPNNLLDLTGTITDIISKKYRYDRIIFTHTNGVSLTSEVPLDFTLDGEYAGAIKHVDVSVLHNAVCFIRPEEVRKKPFPKKKTP